MKLTNHVREAFIRAVMADVPTVDTRKLIDDTQKLVIEHFLSRAPALVKKLWADNSTRHWVKVNTYYYNARDIGAYLSGFYVPCPDGSPEVTDPEVIEAIRTALRQVAEADRTRQELHRKLLGAVNGCSTRKQLATALPEFEKYLPADNAQAVRSVPAIANVVADFVKAGWPKDKQQAAA